MIISVGSGAQASAATAPTAISVNFCGSNTPMASGETAGVVPKANWNNAAGAVSSSALALVSDHGSPTGSSVTWTADSTWYLPITDTAGNNRMMRGYLDNANGNASTVSFSGITSGKYNIYVYTDGDNAGTARAATYQLSGSGITTTQINVTDAAYTNFSGTFVQANSSSGNYVLFSGISVKSGFQITATPATPSSPRAPVNAIQIIPASTTVTSPVGLNVNFTGLNTTAMASSETAGVVPSANWNNVPATASGTGFSLVSSQGLSTGASVNWSSDNTWYLPITDTAGNNRMMHGYLDNGNGDPVTVSFSGIIAGTYNVYVYADGDNVDIPRSGSYQISGSGIVTTNINVTDAPNTNFSGTFIQANNSAGNYVLFPNIAISSGFTLTATPISARAPVNAIQIVPATSGGSTPVAVSITPTAATLSASITQQFGATVSGTSNTAVTWSISPNIGSISAAGLYTAPSSITSAQVVTVTAQSVADPTKSATAAVSLEPAITLPLTITTSSLPSGTAGVAYSTTLLANGGTPPYTWSVLSGSLPAGLTLNGSTGQISGTSSQTGSSMFLVGVSDSIGNQVNQSYSISMLAAVPSYYVSSVNGNDSWSGQLASPNASNTDGPFRTPARAQSAMSASAIKTAYLRGGLYLLSANLQFASPDNNESWKNYPGETPVIDGNNGAYRIRLNGVTALMLWGLTFQNMAGGCTASCGDLGAVAGTSSGLVFEYNTFNNCTNACIMGGGVQHATISNNRFNNLSPGQSPVGDAFAVWLYYGSSNNVISHNSFQNLQGGGVGLGTGTSDPPLANNVIDRNYLNNINTNTGSPGDIGALYIDDMTHQGSGNQITNNVIWNNCGTNYLSEQCKAIYLDDESSNVIVTGNICQNCGTWALQIHGGDHNTIQNNIFDISSPGTQLVFYQQDSPLPDYGMAGNVFTHNLIYTSGSANGITLWNNQRSSTDSNPLVTDNLYYAVSGGTWVNSNPSDSSPVYADPQFTNPAGQNFSMPNTSPAFTAAGFIPLATDQGPI